MDVSPQSSNPAVYKRKIGFWIAPSCPKLHLNSFEDKNEFEKKLRTVAPQKFSLRGQIFGTGCFKDTKRILISNFFIFIVTTMADTILECLCHATFCTQYDIGKLKGF